MSPWSTVASSAADTWPYVRRVRLLSIDRTWSVSTYDVFVRPLGPGARDGYSAPSPGVPVTGTMCGAYRLLATLLIARYPLLDTSTRLRLSPVYSRLEPSVERSNRWHPSRVPATAHCPSAAFLAACRWPSWRPLFLDSPAVSSCDRCFRNGLRLPRRSSTSTVPRSLRGSCFSRHRQHLWQPGVSNSIAKSVPSVRCWPLRWLCWAPWRR